MKLAFDDIGPFILVCIDEIVHECIKLIANPKFVLKNDLTQFLEEEIEQFCSIIRGGLRRRLPRYHPPYFLSTAQYVVTYRLS